MEINITALLILLVVVFISGVIIGRSMKVG